LNSRRLWAKAYQENPKFESTLRRYLFSLSHSLKLLLLLAAGLFSAIVTYVGNRFALQPWRRARDQHWAERARLYFPARNAAANKLWLIPVNVCLGMALLWPDDAPHWSLIALISATCTLLATVPMDHEVFPRIPWPNLWRQAGRNWIIRFARWSILLIAIALMPAEFNLTCLGITIVFLALLLWHEQGGGLYLARKLGTLAEPTERLRRVVNETATRMTVPVREVWLLRTISAQAFAVPSRRCLLFSERLLEILSDTELAAVCAHELAHLTETRRDYLLRYLQYLFFLPWIFITPTVNTFGLWGLLGLVGITISVPCLYQKISHRLEVRADGIAHNKETNPGVYAQALTKLYEDNLLPVVNPKKHMTHPHLYDRLIAAGVMPDFPRPVPAKMLTWEGQFLSSLMGVLLLLLLIRDIG